MLMRSSILLSIICSLCTPIASATTLNLLGRGTNLPSLALSAGGVGVTLSGGLLNSTATTFGIDANTSGGYIDDPNLLDGNETLIIAFDKDVLLDSITISHFDDQDSGSLILKSITADFPLHNGVNNVGGIFLPTAPPLFNTNYRVQSDIGPIAGGTRGFSLDSIDFRFVPEPATWFLAFVAICARMLWPGLRINSRPMIRSVRFRTGPISAVR